MEPSATMTAFMSLMLNPFACKFSVTAMTCYHLDTKVGCEPMNESQEITIGQDWNKMSSLMCSPVMLVRGISRPIVLLLDYPIRFPSQSAVGQISPWILQMHR